MRLNAAALAAATAAVWASGGPSAAQSVVLELRGREGAVSGTVERIGGEGVLVKPDDTSQPRLRWVSWDRVRQVKPEGGRASEYSALADGLWRARVRLERGDLALAGPDIERLTAEYPGLGGPTGTLLAELTLRLRLARGSHTGAALALVRWSATRRAADATAAVWVGGSAGGAAAIDAGTGLAVQCPPIFGAAIGTPAMEAFVRSPQWEGLKAIDPVTRDLAALYRAGAAAELELRRHAEAAPVPEVRVTDPGVLLVREIVLSHAGDEAQRRAAREALEKRLSVRAAPAARPQEGDAWTAESSSNDQRWVEAWCRAAIGRSLLRERDAKDRRRGVVQLLHLPARFAAEQPLLAPTCLMEAAEALAGMGDASGAAAVRSELRRLFPGLAPEEPAETERGDGAKEPQNTPEGPRP